MPRKIGYKMEDVLKKDVLYDLYVTQEMSTTRIAKEYNCSDATVGRLLKSHGIPIRQKRTIKYVLSKEELYDLYINKDMTTYEIGALVGFDEVPVQRLLKFYGIPKKKQLIEILDKDTLYDLRFVQNKTVKEIAKMFDCGKSHIANLIKMHSLHRGLIKEIIPKNELYDLYIKQDKSMVEIAKMYRVRVATISELLEKYKIEKPYQIDILRSALSKEELYDLYINEDLSMTEIGILFDCDYHSVGMVLDEYGIPKEKETLGDVITKERLEELYVKQNKTTQDISDLYNCSRGSIEALLKKYNIETREINEYADIGRKFESLVKQTFDTLNYKYQYQYEGFEGVRVDFYDKENDIILDAKLSSYTPFIRGNKRNFFDKHKGMSDKVIIVYLRGEHVEPIENFEWRHISYYYKNLREIGRGDLIEEISTLLTCEVEITD